MFASFHNPQDNNYVGPYFNISNSGEGHDTKANKNVLFSKGFE